MADLKMNAETPESTYEIFTTCDEHELKLKELRSVFVKEKSGMEKRGVRESLSNGLGELRSDSRRFFNFVKKHIFRRKNKPTEVQEIHIVQEDDGETWARRSADSALSRSSIDSALSRSSEKGSTSNHNKGLEDIQTFENDDDFDS